MKVLSLERIATDRWLSMFRIFYENKNGKKGTWTFVSRNKSPKLEEFPPTNAVIIVARVNRPEGWRLLITKEMRIVVGGYEYGFPAGLMEKGETPEAAATRELFEETGLTITKFIRVSPPIISSAGLSDETVQMVFVEAEGELSNKNLEENEDIEASLFDHETLVRLSQRTGEFEGVRIAAKAWPILYSLEQSGVI